jgi:hypothetical protein
VALTGVLTLVALMAFSSTADVLSVTEATTRAHVEAERCLRLCLSELRKAGVSPTHDPELSSRGLQPADPVTGEVPDDAITFTHVKGLEAGESGKVEWDTLDHRLQFEAEPGETLGNGVDDDGDGRVDEGRVTLYRVIDPDAPTLAEVAVVAHDVSRFVIERVVGAPRGLRTVHIQVQMENIIDRAVRSDDVGALAAGGGPRTRYTARGSLALFD